MSIHVNKETKLSGKKLTMVKYWSLVTFLLFSGHVWADYTIDNIKKTNTIHVSYMDGLVPFAYTHNGKPVGMSIELCNEVIHSVTQTLHLHNVKTVWNVEPLANALVDMKAHNIDIICSPVSRTTRRMHDFNFSREWFYSHTRYMYKKSAPVPHLEDLKGRSIGVVTGDKAVSILSQLTVQKNYNFLISLKRNSYSLARSLSDDLVSAIFASDTYLPGLRLMMDSPDSYAISEDTVGDVTPYCIPVDKQSPLFLSIVNDAINNTFKSGKFDALYKKWMRSPILPDGKVLNIPYPEELRIADVKRSW